MSVRRRSARAAKGHGERREGNEGDAVDAQEVTETSNTRGRTEEEYRGEEEDELMGAHSLVDGYGSPRKQTKGETGQGARRR